MNSRERLEGVVQQLVGERLEQVRYTKLSYDEWDADGELLDGRVLQIVFNTASGKTFYCSWSSEMGTCYGVSLGTEPFYGESCLYSELPPGEESGVHTVDVSQASHWSQLLLQPITSAKIHWATNEGDEYERSELGQRVREKWGVDVPSLFVHTHHFSNLYPQSLEIEIGDTKVYIDAASYNACDKTYWGMMDELVIIFRDDVAKRFLVGPYDQN